MTTLSSDASPLDIPLALRGIVDRLPRPRVDDLVEAARERPVLLEEHAVEVEAHPPDAVLGQKLQPFAAAAAEVLLGHDIPVAFGVHAVPTQMSSYEVVERGAAAGIVITASHNPWTDNGFKVKAPTGSAAGPDILSVIERRLAVNDGHDVERRPIADAQAAGLFERFDPFEGYERFLRRTIDLDALRAADVDVLVEPMWGAGAGWLSRLLRGGRIRVNEIHQERNPYFGGVNPEPIRPNIDEALGMLAGGTYDLGLFLDGDADRAGAADERGTFIHQLQVMGLLMLAVDGTIRSFALWAAIVILCREILVSGLRGYLAGLKVSVPVTRVAVEFVLEKKTSSVKILATVECRGQTGVEMEALTAVSVAALTVYDMCKAVQKDICITEIRLELKTGGKSDFVNS